MRTDNVTISTESLSFRVMNFVTRTRSRRPLRKRSGNKKNCTKKRFGNETKSFGNETKSFGNETNSTGKRSRIETKSFGNETKSFENETNSTGKRSRILNLRLRKRECSHLIIMRFPILTVGFRLPIAYSKSC